jgi:hypothetical protein
MAARKTPPDRLKAFSTENGRVTSGHFPHIESERDLYAAMDSRG